MRIAELSARSGVARATVKYYLREGLLHPGARLAANQAVYDESHVQRLRLVRALVEVGGLSLAAVRGVIDAAGDEARSAHDAFAVAYAAIGDGIDLDADDELAAARLEIDAWIARRGWTIVADAPARAMLARTLVAAQRFGLPDLVHAIDSFADLLDPIAELEVATIDPDSPRERMVERVVVGTLVYERAISATRRLLLEHHSAQLFGGT